MVKVFALLPVRPGLPVEAFHEHWRTVHREHALRIDRIRRYVQAHRVHPGVDGLEDAEWEGVPEVWFDDVASAVAQRTDPQYLEGAFLDEPEFVDMANLRRVMTRPHVVVDPGPALAKLMVFAHDRAGVVVEPEALGSDLADVVPDLAGCAVARAIPVDDLPRQPDGSLPAVQPFDVVVELWWRDLDTLRAAWAARGADVLVALARHLDLGRARAFPCEELVVRG